MIPWHTPPAVASEFDDALVSIGITSFNAESSIASAIFSARSQSWKRLEIIVVDDCSSDDSLFVIASALRGFPRYRVFRNSVNSGVAFSRNKVLELAKGEFVTFFDDDDISSCERVKRQVVRIVGYERAFAAGANVICHTARYVTYPLGDCQIERTMGEIEGSVAPHGLAVARRILLGSPVKDGYGAGPTCSQMARLSTYRLLGGFDARLRRGEDTDFNIRLAAAGGHFVGIAEPLVLQMMTPTSEKSLGEEYRNMRYLLEKHRALMDGDSEYDFCLRWLDAKQAWLSNRHAAFVKEMLYLAFRYPLLTGRRLVLALPNIGLNHAFSRFHSNSVRATQSRTKSNGSGGGMQS